MNKKLLDRAEQQMLVVDAHGKETGKIVSRKDAHSSPGIKHLAFLVFVINSRNEFVLHKRHSNKIGGDSLDSPVSHVLNGESLEDAVHRCLKHEYGIKEKLRVLNFGGFSYDHDYNDGTCENEYCLVLAVLYNGKIFPNKEEMLGKPLLVSIKEAVKDSKSNPSKYAVWFNIAIEVFEKSQQAKKFLQ